MSSDRPAFERALVATSYLLGRRGNDLGELTRELTVPAQRLLGGLAHPERTERAHVLAGELVSLVQALDARRLR